MKFVNPYLTLEEKPQLQIMACVTLVTVCGHGIHAKHSEVDMKVKGAESEIGYIELSCAPDLHHTEVNIKPLARFQTMFI